MKYPDKLTGVTEDMQTFRLTARLTWEGQGHL